MLKAFKINTKVLIVAFTVVAVASIIGIASADQRIMRVKLSTHSFEGDIERIAFYFTEPVTENLYLEVYEFHYIMFPELAPDEDTWPHEKQMSFMVDVIAGRVEGYKPHFTDEKVREILKISPMQTVTLSSPDGKTHYTDWKAKHGRIFFRVKNETKYLNDTIYTMRVHCRHIDMRTVEKLKEQLQAIKLPLKHKNRSFATKLYNDLNTTYTQGHSLRFMLKHHEKETEDLDVLFTQLKGSIANSDFNQAEKLVVQIEHKITEKEKEFYTVNVNKIERDIHIEIEDAINIYSFHEDPSVEVYVKEYREPTMEELMTKAHSVAMDHTHMDPSAHSKMLKPDKNRLTKDAAALEKSQSFFTGSLPEEWDVISVIIFYGADQNYYITNQFKLN
jgi:hypothetical protein